MAKRWQCDDKDVCISWMSYVVHVCTTPYNNAVYSLSQQMKSIIDRVLWLRWIKCEAYSGQLKSRHCFIRRQDKSIPSVVNRFRLAGQPAYPGDQLDFRRPAWWVYLSGSLPLLLYLLWFMVALCNSFVCFFCILWQINSLSPETVVAGFGILVVKEFDRSWFQRILLASRV